jgi:predicted AAA+ superfamily ATPase
MIGRDVLALGVIRRPALLRQVLAVALGAPAQIVSLQKLQSQVQGAGTIETIAHYLDLLRESYILVGLQKYAAREHRRRAAPPKLVALNNALLSAAHPHGPPGTRGRNRHGLAPGLRMHAWLTL